MDTPIYDALAAEFAARAARESAPAGRVSLVKVPARKGRTPRKSKPRNRAKARTAQR